MNTALGKNARFITPNWPAPPGVYALCSTRLGGVSANSDAGQYASLNLGDHVGDDRDAVAANRSIWQQQLQAQTVFLQQVHGSDCLRLRPDTPQGSVADACATQERGLACTIMVADCLPVLFCNAAGTQVAAAHAGWRGLAGGVLEQVLYAFLPDKAANAAWAAHKKIVNGVNSNLAAAVQEAKIMAWLGPCIGQAAFEVGAEVRAAFLAAYPWSGTHFVAGAAGKYLADLAAIAKGVLQAYGVAVYGNDSTAPWCTYSQAELWFSHRRESQRGQQAGRMAASVCLKP